MSYESKTRHEAWNQISGTKICYQGKKFEEKPPRGENIVKHKSFLSEMFPELHPDTRPRRPTEPGFSFQSFGSSMSEKTVRNPNGGLETTRTVR